MNKKVISTIIILLTILSLLCLIFIKTKRNDDVDEQTSVSSNTADITSTSDIGVETNKHVDCDINTVAGVDFKTPTGYYNITNDYFNYTKTGYIEDVVIFGNMASVASPQIIQITSGKALKACYGDDYNNAVYEQLYNSGEKVCEADFKGTITLHKKKFDVYLLTSDDIETLVCFSNLGEDYIQITTISSNFDYDYFYSIIKEL